jgi:hypothetical protein
METQKSPAVTGPIRKDLSKSIISQNKPLGKLDSMLVRFASGERHHRFGAERIGDHALPSTISDLQKRHGIYFDRKRIKVPNRFGSETSVCLYWLSGKNLEMARVYSGLSPEIAA